MKRNLNDVERPGVVETEFKCCWEWVKFELKWHEKEDKMHSNCSQKGIKRAVKIKLKVSLTRVEKELKRTKKEIKWSFKVKKELKRSWNEVFGGSWNWVEKKLIGSWKEVETEIKWKGV